MTDISYLRRQFEECSLINERLRDKLYQSRRREKEQRAEIERLREALQEIARSEPENPRPLMTD